VIAAADARKASASIRFSRAAVHSRSLRGEDMALAFGTPFENHSGAVGHDQKSRGEKGAGEDDRDGLDALLVRVAEGDRAAFSQFYRATSGRVFGIVVRILGRTPLAEDVMQEIYASVWRRAADYAPHRGAASAWLSVVARNRAIDETRRGKHIHVELQEDVFPGLSIDPLADRDAGETRGRLMACLGKLTAERRDAILLAYYKGLSREDLSRRFGKPVSTIKTLLRRSLIQLKTCMTR
jgi:RNA polymerase sigma-70 factor (ECF subfamily)